MKVDEYFQKTLRTLGYVTLILTAALLNAGTYWAVLPFLAGVALAVVLLLGWNGFIRSLTPESGRQAGMQMRWRRRFFTFALVKYPLVALLIWWFTRLWDARSLMVFVGGFLLLHAVILLRTIGRMLTEEKI
jgi:ABC-type lipoprotein release transport system permease subunit